MPATGRADTMTTMRSRGRRERDARGVRAHARRTRDVLARSFLARTIARVRRVRSTRRDAEGATPAVCSYPFMGRVCLEYRVCVYVSLVRVCIRGGVEGSA